MDESLEDVLDYLNEKEYNRVEFYNTARPDKSKYTKTRWKYGGRKDSNLAHSDYLEHHGVRGQQWHVKHGPPYPLRGDNLSKARKDWNKNYKGPRSGTAALTTEHDQEWEEMLTSKTDFGSFGTVRQIMDSNNYESYQIQNNTNTGESWATATAIMKELSHRNGRDPNHSANRWNDNDVNNMREQIENGQVNPNYGAPGTTSNCTKCTFTAEVIRRGLFWTSAGRQTNGSVDAMKYWFVGAKKEHANDLDGYESLINSWGENSSAELNIGSPNGNFYHSVHFTKNGSQYSIEDGQTSSVFRGDSFKSVMNQYKAKYDMSIDTGSDKNYLGITRLDNCEINWKNAEEDGCLRGNRVWNHRTKRVVDTW